jgi:hypothetical protein
MAVFIVFKKLPALAMAVYPFIFLKDITHKKNAVLVNHERIHFRQQLELLIIPFYLLYFTFYFVNRIKKQNHYTAYMNIAFEKEAYVNELNPDYLKTRKLFSWLKYF